MGTSFEAEGFREQRLGIVLDPRKGSNYCHVKILLSVVRTRILIIKMSEPPRAVPER